MDRIGAPLAAVLLAAAGLAGCGTPSAPAASGCEAPGRLDLLASAMVLDRACDEVSPGTRAERERVVSALAAEQRECSAYMQALNPRITAEAREAAEEMRRSGSAACAEFATRIDRARNKP